MGNQTVFERREASKIHWGANAMPGKLGYRFVEHNKYLNNNCFRQRAS
jgi:hypothetical protein